MTTEARPEPFMPESVYADYEQDLLEDGVPSAQARAARRTLERMLFYLTMHLATKAEHQELRAELQEIRSQLQELRERVARLEGRLNLLIGVVAVFGAGIMGMMGAILSKL